MNSKVSGFSARRNFGSDFAIAVGLAAVLLFFIGSGFVAYSNTRSLIDGNRQVAHTHEVLLALSDILSIMKDAETGQRGYVLTGEERYLEPYRQALARIAERVNDAAELTRDNQTQQERIPAVKAHINAKLSELNQTIALRRAKGFQAALA
ncbi:MAG TPA: CHASE3 domain-containing protein, partial [Alphaproteobacteria bacterium]